MEYRNENINLPAGTLEANNKDLTLNIDKSYTNIDTIKQLPLKKNKDKVEHTGIPHSDQFPDDLKNFTAYILWAVDKSGKVLVGSGANRTETVESIREFYANDEAKASIDRHNLEE